tara:strand:+ start:21 stop:482 length:462 start_codon:yes stop_codon:yes gene_type:complete
MKTFKEFFQIGVTKPSMSDVQNYLNGLGTRLMQLPDIKKKIINHFKNIKNLKLDTFGRKVLSFEEFNPEINEKTEYYLDTSQDNTERFVAYDGASWYTGKVGVKGENMFLKFVRTHGKDSYFERAKLKKITPKALEKEVNISGGIDFKKLYKR